MAGHCEHCWVPGRPCILRERGQCDEARKERAKVAIRPGAHCSYREISLRHAEVEPPSPRLVIRSHLYEHGGFGRNGRMLGVAAERLGVPVAYWPVVVDESHLPLDPWARARLVDGDPGGWVLLLSNTLDPGPMDGRRHVHYSMYESTGLPPGAAANLNRAAGVLAPSPWVADVFRANGVSAPIRVVPHGVDAREFRPARRRPPRPFTVGVAARTCHGGVRKGVAEAFEAFRRAFPAGRFPDVRLAFKGFADCPSYGEASGDDPRIVPDLRAWPASSWPRWYHGVDAYLTMSKGEGFGLHGIEALASGVPVVGARWSGQADYLDERVGYEVACRLGPASGDYAGHGEWAIPDVDDAASRLREAYRDPAGRRARSRAARARAASSWSWDRAARMMVDALVEFGALAPPAPDPAPRPTTARAIAPAPTARSLGLAPLPRCRHRLRAGCGSCVNCDLHGRMPADRCGPDACPDFAAAG